MSDLVGERNEQKLLLIKNKFQFFLDKCKEKNFEPYFVIRYKSPTICVIASTPEFGKKVQKNYGKIILRYMKMSKKPDDSSDYLHLFTRKIHSMVCSEVGATASYSIFQINEEEGAWPIISEMSEKYPYIGVDSRNKK